MQRRLNTPFRSAGGWTVAALLLLAGCHPAAQLPLMSPIDVAGTFGYADRPLGDGRVEVSYTVPPRPTRYDQKAQDEDAEGATRLAKDLALWRAAELAESRGAPALRVLDSRSDVRYDTREQTYYPPNYATPYSPFYPPLVDAQRRTLLPYMFNEIPVDYRATWVQARAVLAVAFDAQRTPVGEDAAEVIRTMRTRYPAAYATPGAAPQ
jgi:hypothetical protein